MKKVKLGILFMGAFLFMLGAVLKINGSVFATYVFIAGLLSIVASVYVNIKNKKVKL